MNLTIHASRSATFMRRAMNQSCGTCSHLAAVFGLLVRLALSSDWMNARASVSLESRDCTRQQAVLHTRRSVRAA